MLALAMSLPLAYLAITVADSAGDAADAILRERTLELVLASVGLTAAVTATAIAIAVPFAWLVVRTDLPGRRVWTVAAALPLVIPSYIGAYALISALGPAGLLRDVLGIERLPDITGFPGAWLTLSLFTYPLVLLPVRSALRGLDPQLEEAALGLGRGRAAVFRTVVFPQILPAVGAGSVLVALYVLSDFGAVSILRFDSLTRAIYTSYRASFDRIGAASLSLVLVFLMLLVLWLETRARGGPLHRIGPGVRRRQPLIGLGRWKPVALCFCALVVLLALGVPLAVLLYWSGRSVAGSADWAAIASASGNSLLSAGGAALLAGLSAIPVAVLSVRYPVALSRWVERLTYTGYALPGVVVALALVFFGTRLAPPLYQTLALLVFALLVLFLPLAVGVTRAAMLQVSPRVEEAARSVGRSPQAVLRTVTVPLMSSGVAAGAALVFLSAVKELPAVLILAPIGFNTLATEIWTATDIGFFERGAIPSLVLLAISALPLYALTARD